MSSSLMDVIYQYKCIKVSKLSKLLNYNDEDKIKSEIDQLNKKLDVINLTIKVFDDYCLLVNLIADENVFNNYNQSELLFLKSILSAIINNDDYRLSSNSSLNLQSTLTLSYKQEFLNKLVDTYWLKSDDEFYYLGIRSLIELNDLLVDLSDKDLYFSHFNHIIVTNGYHCSNCETAITKKQSTKLNLSICPSCKTDWKPVEIP
ncbi:hypothetical protein E3Q15_03813 [Wallemia mellicola]|nr:hypothetical protein E3Q15_03813 [Wallemia mellicola]